MTDEAASLAEQYADAENLNARKNLHGTYSVADDPWWEWVFDCLEDTVDAVAPTGTEPVDLLEVGCGPCDLWVENDERVPDRWNRVLTDFSPGMLGGTANSLASDDVDVAVAAAETLPFPENAFDVAVANHMLYHTDPDRSLSELRRVLRPGGRLVATTNGERNMREFRSLVTDVVEVAFPSKTVFSLDNGPPQLRKHFDAVERHDYDDALRVPDVEPLVAYVASLPDVDESGVEAFESRAREALADGPLEITKEMGLLVAEVAE